MKAMLRNFSRVMRRFRYAVILNILGLTVAYTAFLVIIIQIRYEGSFDTCHSKFRQIYRVDKADLMRGDVFRSIHARGHVDAIINSYPQIREGVLINPYSGMNYFTVRDGDKQKGFKGMFITCYPEITKIFDHLL